MKVLDDIDFIGDSRQNRINFDLLKRSVNKDAVSHAYLFIGNDMDKLYKLALSLSAAVSCKSGGCGRCDICKNTMKGMHSDLHIVEAEGNILTVDKIIQLQRFMNQSSYGRKRKICIIKEAELMNPEAANRLLKTLEEPPGSSNLMILLAEDSSRLLPTIISRCLVFTWNFDVFDSIGEFDFEGIRKTMKKGLKEIIVSDDPAHPLDLTSEIISRLDKVAKDIKKSRDREVKKLQDLGLDNKDIKKNIDAVKDRYKRIASRARNLGMDGVFDIISAWLEDIIAVKAGAGRDSLNFKDGYKSIKDNSKNIKVKDIYRLIEIIDRNKRFLKFSINGEISLDSVLLSLQNLN